MKLNIIKGFLILLLSLFAFSAFAGIGEDMQSQFNKLTPQQQAALYKQVTDQQQQNASPAVTADTVKEYTELGSTIGAALAGTAKELGIVANDFLRTPVGMMAAALIVWKIAGDALVHVVGAMFFFVSFVPIWFWAFRRQCILKSVTKTTTKGEGALMNSTVTTVQYREGDESTVGYWVLFGAGVALTAIIALTM